MDIANYSTTYIVATTPTTSVGDYFLCRSTRVDEKLHVLVYQNMHVVRCKIVPVLFTFIADKTLLSTLLLVERQMLFKVETEDAATGERAWTVLALQSTVVASDGCLIDRPRTASQDSRFLKDRDKLER